MKNCFFICALCLSLFCLVWACDSNDKSSSSSHVAPRAESWELVWSDEFDIDDYLDETVWSRISIDSVGYWAEWCKYSRTYDELYDVKDGNLILRGIYNKGANAPYPTDTCTFLTGGVRTLYKKTFFGGDYPARLVVRAKLGTAAGCWPAFWMKPVASEIQDKKGEIDIMERFGMVDNVSQTVHNYWTYYLGHGSNPPQEGVGEIDTDGYNEYSVTVYPEELMFAVNNLTTLTYPHVEGQTYEDQFPYFIYPFFLMLDVQIDGVSKVEAVDPNVGYPVEVCIDWVRYYEFK